ncbi:hypothetical protein [Phenylobacterium ferrooxidans]|uniref:Uncharacterized protein n=1 Tax=Phenylobacterium ferrooxidans TaxID=2982689 RepID=A0ABW6CJB8_9CAUL
MALLALWILVAAVSAWQAFAAGDYTLAFVYAAAALVVPGAMLLLVRRP